MKKLLIKMLSLLMFTGMLQSCLPDTEIQPSVEEEATDAEKVATSTIRVIQVNQYWASPYIFNEGAISLDLDESGTIDLVFHGEGYTGGSYVKSNAGVLRYKNNTSLKKGPYRLVAGQAAPVPNSKWSLPNSKVYFQNLTPEQTYFIGFKVKFMSDQKIHFGWARVKQKDTYGGYLYEVAINDQAETPISAGQI